MFELDLPEVPKLRSKFFPETERGRYLPYSMFDSVWTDTVAEAKRQAIMIVASRLFLCFPEDQIIGFIRRLADLPNAEIVYDTLSKTGLKIKRRDIRKMGKGEAQSYFCINGADAFAAEISAAAQVMEETRLCNPMDYGCNLAFNTRFRMAFSEMFNM